MFYTDNKLQYSVRVETPDPLFARALQQAIVGVEGEIRVAMQYFFQACGARGNPKFSDLLMNTATEELGHIEMLATAVALNPEGAPLKLREKVSGDATGAPSLTAPILKISFPPALRPCQLIPTGFRSSHVYASGNIAADMPANVAAESTGRALAVRLYNMTNDPGMKDMLSRETRCTRTSGSQLWKSSAGREASSPFPTAFRRKWKSRSSATPIWASNMMAASRHEAVGAPATRLMAKEVFNEAFPTAGAEATACSRQAGWRCSDRTNVSAIPPKTKHPAFSMAGMA